MEASSTSLFLSHQKIPIALPSKCHYCLTTFLHLHWKTPGPSLHHLSLGLCNSLQPIPLLALSSIQLPECPLKKREPDRVTSLLSGFPTYSWLSKFSTICSYAALAPSSPWPHSYSLPRLISHHVKVPGILPPCGLCPGSSFPCPPPTPAPDFCMLSSSLGLCSSISISEKPALSMLFRTVAPPRLAFSVPLSLFGFVFLLHRTY